MNDVLSMMEDIDSMHVVKTPCISINSISHDSADSGYLSIITPQTSGCTPKIAGYRTRSSTGALFSTKKHRYRPDPFLCEKVLRHRSKFNYRLNTSEFHNTLDYLVSEKSVEQDSVLEPSCTHDNQNLSLVHSTPSCANNEFDRPLRNRRNWRTTVPVTPASTDFQILSPPPSPAVPSSSDVASEPILEDAEMKLVYTPHGKSQQVRTPPKLKVLIPRVVISPIHMRNSPIITSADNRKLRELRITDLAASSEIKPKKLDFSHRGLCVSLRNSRRFTFDYTGREKVDFLSLLGEESNHLNLVSKILSFLTSQDLCSVSMVSRVWRKICKSDSCANKRKMSFIMRKNTIKENLWLFAMAKKAKREEDIQTSPKSRRYVRKGYLLDVQNLLQVPVQPNSPPVSPSKIKFHSFVKDRLWRKSRKPFSPNCIGANLNRNWDFQWNTSGINNNACSDTYPGNRAFSEIETKTMSEYIKSVKNQLYAYIAFHSYGQLLMTPYGYTNAHIFNYDHLHKISSIGIKALQQKYNTVYKTGCIGEFFTNLPSGLSVDYMAGVLKKSVVYLYNLRDKNEYGFLLPPEQIIPTGEETLDSLVAMFIELYLNNIQDN